MSMMIAVRIMGMVSSYDVHPCFQQPSNAGRLSTGQCQCDT